MPPFTRIYSNDQRDACAEAHVDRGIPAPRVAELAADGLLTFHGVTLESFEIGPNTVRDYGRKLRKRRAGETKSSVAKLPPRDAIEGLRIRLVSAADQELAALERQKPGNRDLERLRQIIRLVREAAAIPGPKDPRPPAPGGRYPGTREPNGAGTTGGMAGAILNAARGSGNDERPHMAGVRGGDGE